MTFYENCLTDSSWSKKAVSIERILSEISFFFKKQSDQLPERLTVLSKIFIKKPPNHVVVQLAMAEKLLWIPRPVQ